MEIDNLQWLNERVIDFGNWCSLLLLCDPLKIENIQGQQKNLT